MQFKQKLKTRLYVAMAFIAFGIMLIAVSFITKTDNYFISSFGLALVVMGIARTKRYFIITKSEDRIRKTEISETDERNISIHQKARGAAFSAYLIISGITVIVLSFLGIHEVAKWISYSMCLLMILFWISYFVYQKKS